MSLLAAARRDAVLTSQQLIAFEIYNASFNVFQKPGRPLSCAS
jgi:hypothetical protein